MMTLTVKNELLSSDRILMIAAYMSDIEYVYKDYEHVQENTVIYFTSLSEE